MRKAQEVERLRLPFSTPLPLVDRIRTELQKSRFLGMQLQLELLHAFRKFRPKPIVIRLAVKSTPDVISKTHHDYVAVRPLLTPRLDPQIEYVMKIDVGQKRRGTAALGRPFLHPYPFPILQHARVEPFLDQSHDAADLRSGARGISPAIRGKAHRKSCEYPDRAPSSLFSSAVPYRARPALDAGCARAGTHTRSPGSRSHR